jgi:nitroreductase
MHILNFLKPKAEVAYIDVNSSIRQCVEKMTIHGFTAIPLLAGDGTYIGTITEGDLLWFIKNQTDMDLYKAEELSIKEVKRRRDNVPVDINASLEQMFKLALRQNFTPVLDDRKMFIGIVTRRDILTYYQGHLSTSDSDVINPVISTILSRRSIRRYTQEKVTEREINKILDAALSAPSAKNRQPVHILVLRDEKIKEDLKEATKYGKMISEAQVVLAVFGDTKQEANEFYLNNDCSAVIENALLAIEALGLGAVWIGTEDEQETSFLFEKLSIPQEMKIYGIIALGHPLEEKAPHGSAPFDKTHFNHW